MFALSSPTWLGASPAGDHPFLVVGNNIEAVWSKFRHVSEGIGVSNFQWRTKCTLCLTLFCALMKSSCRPGSPGSNFDDKFQRRVDTYPKEAKASMQVLM